MRRIITDPNEMWDIARAYQGMSFAFDTETSGLNFRKDRLLGIALYFENGDAFYLAAEHTVKLWDGRIKLVNYIPRSDLRTALAPLFSQHDVLMIAHNSKFDMHFMERIGLTIDGQLFDTLLAAQLLDENRKNGLKDLSYMVGIVYDKYMELSEYEGFSKREFLGVPLDKGAQYAMNDVEATFKLHGLFSQQLREEKVKNKFLIEVFNNIWMPLLVTLQQMEGRGIALDIELVKRIREDYVTRAAELERNVRIMGLKMLTERYTPETIPSLYVKMFPKELAEEVYTNEQGQQVIDVEGVQIPVWKPTPRSAERWYEFNTGSGNQIYDLIFKYSGVRIPTEIELKRTKSGEKYSVDKDNLETLIFFAEDEPPQFLYDVLEWRKATKFIGTYLDRFLADADPDDYNSITTLFNQAASEQGRGGTATGRLSSSNPNLQNIPSRGEVGKLARSMFVARPGYVLIVADYSQMELRVLAHYSQDPELLAAFKEEKDLHILTGAAFARMTYEELYEAYHAGDPKAKELRQLGKTGNFALTYGMGAKKFRRYLLVNNKLDITEEQAQEWIDGYNAMYKVATEWKQRVWKHVRTAGYVGTIGGRKRRLPEAFSREGWRRGRAERQGVNAIIQGSCGDIICDAMPPMQKALRAIGGSLLLQVHDELVAEVPAEYEAVGIKIMDTFMNGYGLVNELSLPLLADAHAGPNWGSAKG